MENGTPRENPLTHGNMQTEKKNSLEPLGLNFCYHFGLPLAYLLLFIFANIVYI